MATQKLIINDPVADMFDRHREENQFIGTIKNQKLREQVLDASAKILQHSLGNIMFKTEGLHPISDSTIHIQCDGCIVDISFWPILGAFRSDTDNIDNKLCAALFHHGKVNGERMNSVELIRNVFCFTI